MKNKKKHISWYLFLLSCFFSVIFLILSILLATRSIDLSKWGITYHLGDFVVRNIITTILHVYIFLLFKKDEYMYNRSLTTVISLFAFPIFFDLLGNLLNWYGMEKLWNLFYFDDFVHFLFPLLIYFGIYIVSSKKVTGRVLLVLLASNISMSLVTLWEIYEYWSDALLGTSMVSGLEDTVVDLTMGLFGILVGVFTTKVFIRRTNLG
jgi:uncharacterized membrane protein YjdF